MSCPLYVWCSDSYLSSDLDTRSAFLQDAKRYNIISIAQTSSCIPPVMPTSLQSTKASSQRTNEASPHSPGNLIQSEEQHSGKFASPYSYGLFSLKSNSAKTSSAILNPHHSTALGTTGYGSPSSAEEGPISPSCKMSDGSDFRKATKEVPASSALKSLSSPSRGESEVGQVGGPRNFGPNEPVDGRKLRDFLNKRAQQAEQALLPGVVDPANDGHRNKGCMCGHSGKVDGPIKQMWEDRRNAMLPCPRPEM